MAESDDEYRWAATELTKSLQIIGGVLASLLLLTGCMATMTHPPRGRTRRVAAAACLHRSL
jgi:hypothetical protein